MKIKKKKDLAAAYYGQIEVPDGYEDCAICGKPVRWPWERATWDENNQVCHAVCVEEEARDE